MRRDGGDKEQNCRHDGYIKKEFFRSAARVETGGKIVAKRASEPRGGLLKQNPRNEYDREENLYVRKNLCKHYRSAPSVA